MPRRSCWSSARMQGTEVRAGARRGKRPRPQGLLGIDDLYDEQIASLLRLARRMDPRRPRNLLRGRKIALLFYEASTRTRVSFEIAAHALGAETYLLQATTSSIEKGESL